MERTVQIKALTAIYDFHDRFMEGLGAACSPGCAACCTVNVVATSLEIDALAPVLSAPKLQEAFAAGWTPAKDHVYRPDLTINQVADFCLRQSEPPADTSSHGPGSCPFLGETGLCRVYAARPFACRAMSSQTPCRPGGEAAMDPFAVTANLAIHQILEHLDAGGVTGNLLDLVAQRLDLPGSEAILGRLRPNRPLPGFLVDPSEEGRFRAFMRRLARMKIDDAELGEFLPLP